MRDDVPSVGKGPTHLTDRSVAPYRDSMTDRTNLATRWMLIVVAVLLVVGTLLSSSVTDDRDRSGEIGNEQGILDRDVEDLEVDPRPDAPGPGADG